MRRVLSWVGIVALVGVGCGGVVVFDDGSNSGGAGGSGPGPGPGPGPSPSSSTGVLNVCDTLCSLPGECFGPANECQLNCEAAFIDGCENQASAYLSCLSQVVDTTTCEFPQDACLFEGQAYAECTTQNSCVTDACEGGGGGACYCSGTCDGSFAEAQCSVIEGGTSCSCYLNGEFYGNCQDFSADSCALETGCCGELFFGNKPQPG